MSNMLSFLCRYGDKRFTELPFTDIDALICSQLSYLGYEKAASQLPAPLSQLLGRVTYGVIERDNRRLFELCATLPRYRHCAAFKYVNDFDPQMTKQFAAITFLLDDGTAFVSFRGTDSTIVGWKEDFMLTFATPVPAQTRAAQYLNEVADAVNCPLRAGGHSKGGNLAVYAAAFCRPDVSDRVAEVYTCDGPGFERAILESREYRLLRPRVHRFLPESSVFGILMEQEGEYTVIDSSSVSVYQHNPYTWKTEEAHFLTKERLNFSVDLITEAQREWFTQLDDAERRDFAEILFSVLEASNPRTLKDIRSSLGSVITTLSAIRNMPEENQARMKEYLSAMLSSLRAGSGSALRKRANDIIRKVITAAKNWGSDAPQGS